MENMWFGFPPGPCMCCPPVGLLLRSHSYSCWKHGDPRLPLLFQLTVLLWWLSFSLACPSSKLLCMVAPIVWAFNHHLREIYFLLLFNVKERWWANFHWDVSVEGENWVAHSEIPEEKKNKPKMYLKANDIKKWNPHTFGF